jgi:hypothetical protein
MKERDVPIATLKGGEKKYATKMLRQGINIYQSRPKEEKTIRQK